MKKNKATFLIVTPSYNQGNFLKETIESVLRQSGSFEIKYVVMDGASTDNSLSVLNDYKKKLDFISEKDDGQTDAINKGIRLLFKDHHDFKNTIVAYINSDDFYTEHAFQSVLSEFNKYPKKKWLVGDARIVDEKGKEIQQLIRLYKKMFRKIFNKGLLLVLNPIPQPSTFIRADAIRDVGLFDVDLNYTMDYEYWLRLMNRFGKPIILNKTLSNFRIHKSSKGGHQFVNQFKEEYEVASKYRAGGIYSMLHKLHNYMIITVYKLLK